MSDVLDGMGLCTKMTCLISAWEPHAHCASCDSSFASVDCCGRWYCEVHMDGHWEAKHDAHTTCALTPNKYSNTEPAPLDSASLVG